MAEPYEGTDRPAGLPFFDEYELKELIVGEPWRAGVNQPAAAAMEVRVPPMIGRADVLIVDAEGTITIVECKLRKNAESHGAVIGQALSYAAGLQGCGYGEFRERFEEERKNKPAASLTAPFEDTASWDEQRFAGQVEEHLKGGEFRVVIATDELSEQLNVILGFIHDRRLDGIALSTHEAGRGVDRPKDVPGLIEQIRRFHGDAAASRAEAILKWAEEHKLHEEHKLQVEVDSERHEAKVSMEGTLFRIKRYREVRVSEDRIRQHLMHHGAGVVHRFEQDLHELGMEPDGKKARIQLKDLGEADEFTSMMERVVKWIRS